MLTLWPQQLAAAAGRFVSMNLCTDQLLMLLADPEEIISLSYLARREDVSVMAQQAKRFPANHGQAEEIMRQQPDLVLAGVFPTRATVFMLKRLGFKVAVLPVARDFKTIVQNIRTVANATGHPARGEQLIARFNHRLQRLKQHLPRQKPVAVMYRENSYTTGSSTLADEIIRSAGLTNLSAQFGIEDSSHLPLEKLLMHPVDIIIQGRRRSPDGSVAAAVLQHPAYRYYVAQRKIAAIDDRLWICGTPFVLDAVNQLRRLHESRP